MTASPRGGSRYGAATAVQPSFPLGGRGTTKWWMRVDTAESKLSPRHGLIRPRFASAAFSWRRRLLRKWRREGSSFRRSCREAAEEARSPKNEIRARDSESIREELREFMSSSRISEKILKNSLTIPAAFVRIAERASARAYFSTPDSIVKCLYFNTGGDRYVHYYGKEGDRRA